MPLVLLHARLQDQVRTLPGLSERLTSASEGRRLPVASPSSEAAKEARPASFTNCELMHRSPVLD